MKVPLTWTAAVALIVAAIIGVGFLLSDRRQTLQSQTYVATRGLFDTVAAPAAKVVAAPGRWTGSGLSAARDYLLAGLENRRLRDRVAELQQWHDRAIALQDENNRLRGLLGLKLDPPIPMVSALVIADSHGPYANTRLADVGGEQGVVEGNPVISEHGMIGRVLGVGHGVSRILLLTDISSRTPVLIVRTNARAILSGDGGPNPKLAYLRGVDPVRLGDRVLTSGDGGLFPRGLPVGEVVKGLDGAWRVHLYADDAPIDYVRILLFKDFSQLSDLKELNNAVLPPLPAAQAAQVAAMSRPAPAKAAAEPAATSTAPAVALPAAPASKPPAAAHKASPATDPGSAP